MNVSRRGFLWLAGAAGTSFAGGCASGRLFTAGSLPMDPRVVRIESLLFDLPQGDQHPRVFADALLADNQMITEVFLWDEDNKDYISPFRKSADDLNMATQRSGTLKCADIDNDGFYEIPLRKRFIQNDADEVAMGYLLTWCGIEGEKLEAWTHNKAIQKATESHRISPEQKQYLKTLKKMNRTQKRVMIIP